MTAESIETVSQRALRESELSYRRLFESAQDGILILDVDSGRIDDVNPFLLNLLGFSRDEVIGKTVGELSPFKDIESNHAMLKRLQRDHYVRYDDLPLETRSGKHIAVEFVSNVYPAGARQVIQCNIRDITARKHAEQEVLRLNAELETRVENRTAELLLANRELEAFSYSVSHDLRAPLRHVLGFVELLRKDAEASLSDRSRHYLATITAATSQMGELIDDLLTFSRVGRAPLKLEDISLDRLVAEVVADATSASPDRHIIWTLHPLPVVRADRALLRMALVNLISNAVKFTGATPAAAIEVGCREEPARGTVIFVRDNGAGFDPRYAAKLFGVFQRLHSQSEFEGTGIGLANVQRIIHRHKGEVWAEGTVNGGATFSFSLPTAEATS